MRRVTYPFELSDENTIRERTVYDKLRNFILEALSNKEYRNGDTMEIPLNIILPYVSDCCSSVNELELVYIEL